MEEVKENIIKIALNQFNQIGIRNVSIDDVCAELRISKKTFYQYFKKKEDLIDSVIEYERTQQMQKVQKTIKDKNAIEVFVFMIKEMKKSTECKPFMFWHDLKKYYPALFQKYDQVKKDAIRQAFEQNITQGIQEGYYRTNLDIELLSYFHSIQIKNTFETMMHESPKKYTLKRLTDFFIDMIIHLIANEKGLKFISENLSDKK
ncbi:MAG: hypothetical protein BGO29_06130 [Bacteroidales bacterium 36-12]|jgi:AcrR family transcriptional regulator|nr:MAG: hypothetical protein BGO29_06130 [Bacteroidales bacterium 36-12]